jgi:hypothetical protein
MIYQLNEWADYPVKSTDYFYEFFDCKKSKNSLAIEKFGTEWWMEAERRIVEYHMTDFDFKEDTGFNI